jgi:phage gpG-like protein
MLKQNTKILVKNDRTGAVALALKLMGSLEVLVGIPAEKAPRTSAEAKTQPINNAALGYIHNYGSPTQNIPARPFMEPGIKDARAGIEESLQRAGVAALDGNPDKMMQSLHAAGIKASTSVKNKINSNIPPPLGESTLAARRRRGRTGTKTLIDTGQLRNSITYVVRKRS